GCMPPPGLPERFISAQDAPLEQLVKRFARTHGPFTTREIAAHLHLRPAQLDALLRGLTSMGTLVNGELRPGGAEREWCDQEVLRRLKRRTLARLRNEVAAVDGAALGRFLPRWHGLGSASEGRGAGRLLEVIGQLEGLALPWSLLSTVLLPARVADFDAQMLDMLCAGGEVIWIGCSPLGGSDGRVALYRRANARRLLEAPVPMETTDQVHDALLAHLQDRGASFLSELADAARTVVPGLAMEDFKSSLWDLVWAGLVTNDTFAPLRGLGRRTPRRSRRGAHEALAGGRWSLVSGLVDDQLNDTERAVNRARMLLDRYGIVSREAVQSESLSGGFSPLYKVLQGMEDAGRVRRGYFVEGLSGAQFAEPGAIDRLRAARRGDDVATYDDEQPDRYDEDDVVLLASQDPANVWGALLAWPDTSGADALRPRRAAGTWVVLVDGRPVLWVGVGGRQIATFADTVSSDRGELELALEAIHRIPAGAKGRTLHVEQIDGAPAHESVLADLLLEHGFVRDHKGLLAQRTSTQGSKSAKGARRGRSRTGGRVPGRSFGH
ncbi:MAG: crosslink repair DNA glycosylase YcaQ family protein, partial [Pseudomonadota bacterium]